MKGNSNRNYDVIVCGGGPAGIGAAAAASLLGARTLLVESCNFLGGMSTGAFISLWCDTPLGPVAGMLLKELQKMKAVVIKKDLQRYHPPGRYVFDREIFKAVSAKILKESGCDILLGTVAENVYLEDRQVKGVYTANKDGRTLFKSHTVIDATADGQLACDAGADYMKGEPCDERLQHVNFKMLIDGCDFEKIEEIDTDKLSGMFEKARKSGVLSVPEGCFSPSFSTFPLVGKKINLGKWEIEGVDSSDARQVSDKLIECQIAAVKLVDFCRRNLAGFENLRIVSFPALLGTRESRRIVGEYILNTQDVLNARKFDDGVVKASFWCDFHDSPPGTTVPYKLDYINAHRPKKNDWYEIPYRCLVPKNTNGILVAGRCISADRWAQASMRVQPTCMYTGAAAGTAAAMCSQKGIFPREVDGKLIKKELSKLFI
jgi:hypothetical protein